MTQNQEKNQLPQFPEPLWRNTTSFPSFPSLSEDIESDVVIVGAGISGITTAYILAKEGLKVAVMDAGNILNGTTGHTTAKITAQHGLIYDELINSIGIEKASQYFKASSGALSFIKQLMEKEKIPCQFNTEDAYVYTNSNEELSKLENEIKAYEKLSINGHYLDSLSLPFQTKAAIVMKDQALFHPLQYLIHLVKEGIKLGCHFFENTVAVDMLEGDKPTVITKDGYKVTGKYVVIASHFPFYDGLGAYFTRMYAERSYVLAVKTKTNYPGGMYINSESPTRSLRPVLYKNEELVLFGGENHKTGQGINTHQHYEALEEFANSTFGVEAIPYRWSTQDLVTLDKIPYIGHLTSIHRNIFVATGYRKWGMTNGTAASILLSDLILQRDNEMTDLFSPSRFNANPSIKNFFSVNTDVAKHLIAGKIQPIVRTPKDLSKDEGAVVTVNGKRAGAYKDQDGKLHVVDTTCTHLGCELEWNCGERTWDCPCHGSRFSFKGEVIEGPAEKPLKKVE